MSKNIKNISNALKLYLFNNDMTAKDFSEKSNIPPANISKLINGKLTRIHSKTQKLLSNYFGFDYSLIKLNPDIINSDVSDKESYFPDLTIPRQIKLYDSLYSDFFNNESNEHLIVGRDISINCFAIKMYDDSMEGEVSKNDILVFKPITLQSEVNLNNKIVLIKDDSEAGYSIRKVIADGEDLIIRYYKDINQGNLITILNDHSRILAWCLELRRKSF